MRFARQSLLLLLCIVLVAACSPAMDWREYRFEVGDGEIAAMFPQKPGRAERTIATPQGAAMMRMFSVRVGETLYGVGVADFANPVNAASAEVLTLTLAKNINGQITKSEVQGEVRTLTAQGKISAGKEAVDAELRAKIIVNGKRYLQAVIIGKRGTLDSADHTLFFNSARIER
jgi:hypothetical protein